MKKKSKTKKVDVKKNKTADVVLSKEEYSLSDGYGSKAVKVYKDFIRMVGMFPRVKSSSPYNINIGDANWEIGSGDALPVRTIKGLMINKMFPGLDIRHGKLLVLIFSKYKELNYDWSKQLEISFYKLCREYYQYKSIGRKEYEEMADLLLDLAHTYIKVANEDGSASSFTLINIEHKYTGDLSKGVKNIDWNLVKFNGISFTSSFRKILEANDTIFLYCLADVLFNFKHTFSEILYFSFPYYAWNRSEQYPFRISLTEVLEKLREDVPKKKALRLRKFVRHDRDYNVIAELDGAPLAFGRIFRCKLEQEKRDWFFCAWTEQTEEFIKKTEPNGILYSIWKEYGGTAEEWLTRIRKNFKTDFTEYELSVLDTCFKQWEESENCLRTVKSIVANKFEEILGDMRYEIMKGKHYESRLAYLIERLKECIKSEAIAFAEKAGYINTTVDDNISQNDEKQKKSDIDEVSGDFALEQLSEAKEHDRMVMRDMKRIEWEVDIDSELKEKMINEMIRRAKQDGTYDMVISLYDNNKVRIKEYFATLAFMEFFDKGIFV